MTTNLTAAERARGVARQRQSFAEFGEALLKHGITLPAESRLLDVEESSALRSELQSRFTSARQARQHQSREGLRRPELGEQARAFFSRQRQGQPRCLLAHYMDMGALELPAAFLAEHLPALLDLDGDTVIGRWGADAFAFDYTADLGDRGYEVILTSDS